jgi:hypothetical protein
MGSVFYCFGLQDPWVLSKEFLWSFQLFLA